MSFDLMLDWVSESGSGTWEEFKQTHEWLRRADLWNGPDQPKLAASALATLGHLEVDWLNRTWAAAPSVLTILPNAGAYAVLCGSRTRVLMRRLSEAVAANADVFPYEVTQPGGPRGLYFSVKDEKVAEGLAAEVEIRYDYSVSTRISDLLPALDSYLEIAAARPAPTGAEADRFETNELAWLPAARTDQPGAYRYKVYGSPEFRYISPAGFIYRMDRDLSVYAVLRDAERSTLRWEPQATNGTLVVKQNANLPLLHGRSAALCTGLAPAFDFQRRETRYLNVPREIAEKIAFSLGQILDVAGAGRSAAPGLRRGRA